MERVEPLPAPVPIVGSLAPAADASGGPLSAEHYRQLEVARQRRKSLDRASGVAAFHAWSYAILAALTLPMGLLWFSALVAGVVLAVLAAVEFYGRALLRKLDRRGPVVLGCNQIGCFLVLSLYSVWQVYRGVTEPESFLSDTGGLSDMIVIDPGLITLVVLVVYASVILASALVNGGSAIYYFSKLGALRAYRDETPAWIVEVDRRR